MTHTSYHMTQSYTPTATQSSMFTASTQLRSKTKIASWTERHNESFNAKKTVHVFLIYIL